MSLTTPCKHGWVGYCQKCAPKRLGPDPVRPIVLLLWPLVFIDMVAWKFYVGGLWGGIGCALYFLILIGSIVYLKKTS